MNNHPTDTGVSAADFAIVAMTLGLISFVVYQFRIGEASGRGGWVKKAEHPRRFAFMMTIYLILATVFIIVSALDVYARIHHLPRSMGHTGI